MLSIKIQRHRKIEGTILLCELISVMVLRCVVCYFLEFVLLKGLQSGTEICYRGLFQCQLEDQENDLILSCPFAE